MGSHEKFSKNFRIFGSGRVAHLVFLEVLKLNFTSIDHNLGSIGLMNREIWLIWVLAKISFWAITFERLRIRPDSMNLFCRWGDDESIKKKRGRICWVLFDCSPRWIGRRQGFQAVSLRRVLYGRSWSPKMVRTPDEISVVGSLMRVSMVMVTSLGRPSGLVELGVLGFWGFWGFGVKNIL